MKHEIIPACMPERFDDIEGTVASVKSAVQTIQLDLMDGKYVPETTWPFQYEHDYKLDDLKNEDGGFPFWESLDYELDLMCERPEEKLSDWLHIGASRVIFHYASVYDWEKIKAIDYVTRNFVKIGLAVTIHDDLEKVFLLMDDICFDFVQVMGIDHIGYMGEPFDERSLSVISDLRGKYPEMIISVDGSVSEQTISLFKEAGANRFVSGSSVFGQGLASENVEYLRDIVEEE